MSDGQIASGVAERFDQTQEQVGRVLTELRVIQKDVKRINGSVADTIRRITESEKWHDLHDKHHEVEEAVKAALAEQSLKFAADAQKNADNSRGWWKWVLGIVVTLALGGDDLVSVIRAIQGG